MFAVFMLEDRAQSRLRSCGGSVPGLHRPAPVVKTGKNRLRSNQRRRKTILSAECFSQDADCFKPCHVLAGRVTQTRIPTTHHITLAVPDGSKHSDTEIRLVSSDKANYRVSPPCRISALGFVVHGIPGGTDASKYTFRRHISSGCRDLCVCCVTSDTGAKSQDAVSQYGTGGSVPDARPRC